MIAFPSNHMIFLIIFAARYPSFHSARRWTRLLTRRPVPLRRLDLLQFSLLQVLMPITNRTTHLLRQPRSRSGYFLVRQRDNWDKTECKHRQFLLWSDGVIADIPRGR